MLAKNLKLYKEKYFNVPDKIIDRVYLYLYNIKFRKNDKANFYKRVDEIQSIGTNSIRIVFDIIPEPTPRPRLSFKTGTFYVKNSKSNNQYMKIVVENNDDIFHLITTPCEFIVKTYHPISKSFNRIETLLAELGLVRPVTTPDWDNLGKTYSDMVQKWLLLNDSLITDGISRKYYSLKPRVEITINYKLKFDSPHNKKIIESSKSYLERIGDINASKS